MEEFIMTKKGYEELQAELKYLKSVKRVEVAHKIGVARDFGDLSENAEYSAAKDEQSQIEMEIQVLENKIANAKIVEEKDLNTKQVSVGIYVKILDIEFDEELVYQIVGSSESDPSKGMISNVSPVGSALIGKGKGEVVTATLPNGKAQFKILEISKHPIKI